MGYMNDVYVRQQAELEEAEGQRMSPPEDNAPEDDEESTEYDALDGILKDCGVTSGMKAIDTNAPSWYWLKDILLES